MKSVLLLLIAFHINGCSLLVRSGGTYESEFFNDYATYETIERQLGKPILTQHFDTPKYLPEVPEFEQISSRLRLPRDKLVSFYSDFHYRGWIRRPGDNAGYVYFFVITAGLSEILLFPQSIMARVANSRNLHTFRVWFSPDGDYVYHLRIDANSTIVR